MLDEPPLIVRIAGLVGFMDSERQAMPILHLGPLRLEVCGRSFAVLIAPPVGEQDTAPFVETMP